MLRRCIATLAILSAASIVAGGPAPALAASIVSEIKTSTGDEIVPAGTPGSTKYAYYSLKNTEPAPINALVVAFVDPTGSVITLASNNGSPLTVVGGSSGFDTSSLAGLLSGAGVTPQGIALDFSNEPGYKPPYNNPFAPAGVANFKLSLDPSYSLSTPPTLTLQGAYTDLSLMAYTPVYADAGPNAPSTPEPASMALWSALAAAGLLRARAFRRSRRMAAAHA